MATLRSDIGRTVETLSNIRLDDLNELHRLEEEIEAIRPGLAARLQQPSAPDQVAVLGALVAKFDAALSSAVLSRLGSEPGCDTLEAIVPRLRRDNQGGSGASSRMRGFRRACDGGRA